MNTSNEPNGLSVRTLLTVAGLIVLFFLAGHLWDTYASSASVVKTNVPVTEKAPAGVRFAKIQEIQVGERAIGKNPEIDDEDRRSFFPDPDPATWRKLTLEMLKPDGKRLDITLLRPLTWLEESSAEPGATIYLDLAELGAQGNAKVITVEPCPPIKPGKGNVVTGTFHHEAANTIDLYVDGVEKPIGTTDNHPFWSVTKQEFVEAGKLLPGEELQLHSGQTAKVVQLLPRPGPERVHNLEVLNEHVYRVAHEGVLVHNSCQLDVNNQSIMGHIFRNADGHVNPKPGPARDRYIGLFNLVSKDSTNQIPRADAIKRGFINTNAPANVEVFAKTMSDGKQIWVVGWGGQTRNAGENATPR